MELVFIVRYFDYLKDLLHYLGDKGYMWVDGDSLYKDSSMYNVWDICNGEEMAIVLDEDGVSFNREFNEDEYSRLRKQYYIIDCDTIDELRSQSNSVIISIVGQLFNNRREYVIDVPDILRLDGYTEPPVLTRNGDTYLLENGAIYGDAHLFTKTEAEQALKELNVNWGITKVK